MAWAVVCNTRLGSVRWHHAGPRGMRHGTSGGTRHVSWLGSRAPCKALWHASWHGWWHASRVLAWLVGTMQGPRACVMAWEVARVMARAVARVRHYGGRGSLGLPNEGRDSGALASRLHSAPPRRVVTCSRVVRRFNNDRSTGSPTETLLRILFPLNDKVQWTSRDVTGGGPLMSPRSEHFTRPFNR